MRRTLNLGQRIVLLIAWGLALAVVGQWATNDLWSSFGWVAYAPLSDAVNAPGAGAGAGAVEELLLWLGVIATWAAGALLLLGGRKR